MPIYYESYKGNIDVSAFFSSKKTLDNYNAVLGDPSPGIVKHIRIESNDLSIPIYIREDTPISIDMSGKMPDLYVVYVATTNDSKSMQVLSSSLDVAREVHLISSVYDLDVPSGIRVCIDDDPYMMAKKKMIEIAQTSPTSIIAFFHSMSNSWIKDELISHISRWRHNREIYRILPSIDRMGYTHTPDGNIPYDFFYVRSSYISTCRSSISGWSEWLRSGTNGTLSYKFFDTMTAIGYVGFVCRPTYNVGSDPIPAMIITPTRGMISITPTYQGTPHAGFGLFNQLNNIYNSIVIASMCGRDIVLPSLYPQWDRRDTIPLSTIIDIDDLNSNLRSMSLSTIRIGHASMHRPSYHESLGIWFLDNHSIASLLSNEQHPHIDIGCCSPMNTIGLEAISIMKNVRYTQLITSIVDYCLSIIGRDYHSVHLRLEDDWIDIGMQGGDFDDKSVSVWSRYKQVIEKVIPTTSNLFIATHLCKKEYRNNKYMDILRSSYPNIKYNIDWRSKFSLPSGREIDALIDYLICCNGKSFIGCLSSTFSIAAMIRMRSDYKYTILI